jgi:GntR family transcriptional regulator, transcriptional repressor for pyruvate dehydrogenase complex
MAVRKVPGAPAASALVAAVLEILSESASPTGSRVIHERLLALGHELSESTVGRVLGETDRAGYTRPHGRLGRTLTPEGHRHVHSVRDRTSRDENAKQLMDILRGETLIDLRNVLVARRGIEREIAREAASQATAADVRALQAQARRGESGESTEGLHALLVQAAHNPFLESIYRLITRDPGVQRLLDQLPTPRDATFDARMIDAIERRNADLAEAIMVEHLDELVATVDELRIAAATPRRRKRRSA